MEVFRASSIYPLNSYTTLQKTQFQKPSFFNLNSHKIPILYTSFIHKKLSKSKIFTTISPASTEKTVDDDTPQEPVVEYENQEDKFDWFSNWYPVMPICDLDKKVPHAIRILGLDLVLWWDKHESAWKVFDDKCPHRLAPLSEGRIDQWGRLQCVYHGWCFNGSGDCKFIPQAPQDGPPVHTFKKACVAIYPTTVQHDIVWFWPSTDAQYKDVILKKKPPYIPELDDPSFTKSMGNRDIPYGYEVLMENLMDPSHVAYAHYGLMQTIKPSVKLDREGGRPYVMAVKNVNINGFVGTQDWGVNKSGFSKFIAPGIYYGGIDPPVQRRSALIFMAVPVSPGYSRFIWALPRNYGLWIDKIVPRWIFHILQNLIVDSDLYLLHLEERKIMDAGPANWQKTCFVPAKSDAFVVGFRRWIKKYAGGQLYWKGKYSGPLPPTPPREQLFDRYRSHVVNCSSCRSAYKSLNTLEVVLQIVSIVSIGVIAALKQNAISVSTRAAIVSLAVLCFAASRLLAHFIYKNFHYHDYNHTLH